MMRSYKKGPVMHRRDFLAASAAAGVATLATPFTVRALEIGGRRLRTVSDGNLTLPAEFMFGPMPQGELADILAAHGIDPAAPLTPPCNVTVLEVGERVVLFDAGAGDNFQPDTGLLVDALDHVGIAPEDVTHVVFTHGHPDHLWGILDDFDDLVFADAVHMMGAAEHAYWTDPDTVESIGEARASFAVGARRRLEALEGEMVLFGPDEEILPGIAAVPAFGHTPGHTAFRITDGAASAMVVGDAIGNPHVAFAKPEWPSGSDQNPERAAKTRAGLLAELASEGTTMVGFHLPDGGIGRVVAEGDAYRFEPVSEG